MEKLIANKDAANLRLDKFLCRYFDISFHLAQKFIRQKDVKLAGNEVLPNYKLQMGDEIEIFSDLKQRIKTKKRPKVISPEKQKAFQSYIIYEDENIVVINKPSGLAVQGGSNVSYSVDDHVRANKWHLVHRLDRDTSGILIIAKKVEAMRFLTDCFKEKTIRKIYHAFVNGKLSKKSGVINIPLKKKAKKKKAEKIYPDFEDGKEAITKFKVLKEFNDYSLVELRPVTGRTHQLRVHMKEMGCPIINDVKYGSKAVLKPEISDRLCLHAREILLDDYFGKKLEIKCEEKF